MTDDWPTAETEQQMSVNQEQGDVTPGGGASGSLVFSLAGSMPCMNKAVLSDVGLRLSSYEVLDARLTVLGQLNCTHDWIIVAVQDVSLHLYTQVKKYDEVVGSISRE